MVRMRSGSRLCVQQQRVTPLRSVGRPLVVRNGRPKGLGDRARGLLVYITTQPNHSTALQLLQRRRLPSQPAPAGAPVITDEASPFALRSTRNSFRGEQCPSRRDAGRNDRAGRRASETATRGSLTCRLVPLAGLEPATCCLGDNCRYFVLYGPVRSGQVRLGRDSVESGLVRFSKAWWNDRENDHLSKQ
jgi:hypothetical protein